VLSLRALCQKRFQRLSRVAGAEFIEFIALSTTENAEESFDADDPRFDLERLSACLILAMK